MSIGNLMRTSVSGMNAQATRLAGVSENIANANTTGYKRQTTEFSSLVLASGKGQYNSGVVEAKTRQLVSQQGGLTYTSNSNNSQAVDLAIQGKGMMIVSDGQGGTFMTRAGSFVKNDKGDLVNAAGYVLQGYPLPMGDTNGVLNGFGGLQNVNLNAAQLRHTPTDNGILRVNLPIDAGTKATNTQDELLAVTGDGTLEFTITLDGGSPVTRTVALTEGMSVDAIVDEINSAAGATVATVVDGRLRLTSPTAGASSSLQFTVNSGGGDVAGLGDVNEAGTAGGTAGPLPSENSANSVYGEKASLNVYDNAGRLVTLDVYMTKLGDNTWEYTIYDRGTQGAGSTAPFPYSQGALVSQQVTFNNSGELVGPNFIDLQIPNGKQMRLDISGTSQAGSQYEALAASANGNAPGTVDQIVISDDGIVSARFDSGDLVPLYKIPLAMVESPDNLRALAGNVFMATRESGEVMLGFPGESGLGSLVHGALEQSTVDLASELTTMIESQRSYTANSKVFQTGSEILDVLVNLKR